MSWLALNTIQERGFFFYGNLKVYTRYFTLSPSKKIWGLACISWIKYIDNDYSVKETKNWERIFKKNNFPLIKYETYGWLFLPQEKRAKILGMELLDADKHVIYGIKWPNGEGEDMTQLNNNLGQLYVSVLSYVSENTDIVKKRPVYNIDTKENIHPIIEQK